MIDMELSALSSASDAHPILPAPLDQQPAPTLSPLLKRYVASLTKQLAQSDTLDQPMVGVSEGLGVLAFAYEKLRNSVEYHEEHVLLRAAIKRILKRRFGALWNYEPVANALLRELIWARYIPNDAIPQQKLVDCDELLKKYALLYQVVSKMKAAAEWQDWVVGIAACGVEQILVGRQASYSLAELLYQWLLEHVAIEDMAEDDIEVQLYLAVHRTLLKSDRTLLTYHLFLLNVPEWKNMSEADIKLSADSIKVWRSTIDAQLDHQQAQALSRAIKPFTPPFLTLDQIVRSKPSAMATQLLDWSFVKTSITEVCQKRYAGLHDRVRRATIRSMIYILITKMVLAAVLEIPYDTFIYSQVHWPQLWVNVLVPPALMAILGLSIKTPGLRNTQAIEARIKHLLDDDAPAESLILTRSHSVLSSGFSWIYTITNLAIIAGLSWLLYRWHFNWLEISLFIFFMCVVIFFAYRVRQIANEFSVVRERENFVEAAVTFLTLPFLRIGYRVSAEFSKVNVFAFILDVLLEAPFKLMLDLFEHWLDFVRQKREEVVDRHEY